MGSPYNIVGCASQLFLQDKASAEYEALSMIAESLVHPQRTVLSVFVRGAADREFAARYFLGEVTGHGKAAIQDFLANWITLLQKVRPVACVDLEQSMQQAIWHRDGGRCCLSAYPGKNTTQARPLFVHILSPTLFQGDDMLQNGPLYEMLAAFVGEAQLRELRSYMEHKQDPHTRHQDFSDQLLSLSPSMFDHFKNGRVSVTARVRKSSLRCSVDAHELIPSVRVQAVPFKTFEHKATDTALLPNARMLETHCQFSDAWAWLEVQEYMATTREGPKNRQMLSRAISFTGFPRGAQFRAQALLQKISGALRALWTCTPSNLRAFAYRNLAMVSSKLYGSTGSARTHRLPFNLYLRSAPSKWGSKHQAEFASLRLVEQHTKIPAPRGVDVLQYGDSSYLLMTGCTGKEIEPLVATMTDAQLQTVASDLKKYTDQLREIPHNTPSGYQICNVLGGGIQDWRIGDSQRMELKFQDEDEFNAFLTHDLHFDEEIKNTVEKAHSVKHRIVLTHADLNLKNILVDETGKISGIVDWETAGWYPEYWEYSKMHFTTRYTVRWIADVIDQVFTNYRDELRAEDILSGYGRF